MGTVVIDDDGSEWSMEILDGGRVDTPTKSVKQTPPRSTSPAGPKSSSREVHPFFMNEFSTGAVTTGSQSKNEDTTTQCARGSHEKASRILPWESTGRNRNASNPISAIPKSAKESRQVGFYPTIPAHELLDKAPPDNRHERVQFQKQHQFVKSHQPGPLTKTSSSPSIHNNSDTKANEKDLLLPVYSFMEYEKAPAIVYTKSESEANSLVQTLKGPLGFDLEWRVMWHPGTKERRAALVQLCDHDTILLIQVSSMKRFPKKVLEVIESVAVVKTGANILNDGEKLFRDFGIRAKGLVELGGFATRADDKFSSVYNREIVSLAKLVAMYLGRTLLKGKVRTSNWEADLSREMTEYAANDCHCALMVFDRIQEIAIQAGKTLDASTYSCQVNPCSIKPTDSSLSTLTNRSDVPVKPAVPNYCIPEPPRPQQLRAYKLWHVDKMPLDRMCMTLRTGGRIEPLKESTVISYVVGALQADPRLPFNMDNLKSLVLMEASSWQRHRQWIASRE